MTTKEFMQKQLVTETTDGVVRPDAVLPRGLATFLDRPLATLIPLTWETIAWVALLITAAFLRFVNVGVRAMSHDESLHALYSFYLYDTGKYEHNPMMHGPLLFHLNAIAYFLFGDSDATARLMPVLAGIGVVAVAWLFRRYIGRTGALVAGVLITISPSLLFHSRYIRNDIYIALFLLIWIYGAFRYLETRQPRWLLVVTLGMAFGFITKENHFMNGAIMGAFFLGLACWQLIGQRLWVAVAPVIFAGGLWYWFHLRARDLAKQAESMADQAQQLLTQSHRAELYGLIVLLLGAASAITLVYLAFRREDWPRLRQNASVDLAVLMLTLILPFISPFVLVALGWELKSRFDNVSAWSTGDMVLTGAIVAVLTLAAFGIALLWYELLPGRHEGEGRRLRFATWIQLMGVFWLIQVLFFTTFLTNIRNGLATGIVGSLGYWLAQQDVARGGQPWYYYFMLGSLYEFLPWLLSIVGALVIIYQLLRQSTWDPTPTADLPPDLAQIAAAHTEDAAALRQNRAYFVVFTIWWSVAAWLAYTVAGEKMPWLMTHMALPMCILGGWWFGRLLHRIEWSRAWQAGAIWLMGMAPALIFVLLLIAGVAPSQDRSLSALAGAMQRVLAILLGGGLIYLIWCWGTATGWRLAVRLLSIGCVALLFLLTVRFSYMLNYINYDMATEYLVYAHASPDIKRALNELDSISERTVGGRNIVVAYDDDSSWPLSWYMRLYPNHKFYGASPSGDAMTAPVILVGPKNYDKVHPYVLRDYVKRTYRLVWWPDMDYFNMTWDRFTGVFLDPQQRERVWQIFFYRRYRNTDDYSQFRDLAQWPHRHEFEMWVRRDLAAQIWDLGVAPVVDTGNSLDTQVRQKEVDLAAVAIYNSVYGDQPLVTPRTVAIGPNGERVIGDSGNNRVVVLDREGNFLRAFGSTCRLGEGAAGGCLDPDGSGPLELGDGQFNELWGIAIDAQGQIFVADTWNGRIQVFDAEGKFLRKWGVFSSTGGELSDAYALFGPRGLAIDLEGNLLVADTGNKRIIKFTPNGDLVQQVGGGGVIGGRFEEPVGVAVSPLDGSVFVADTWNKRVQKLTPNLEFMTELPVSGWESQDITNKPYLAVAGNGDLYVTDPQLYRVLVYDVNGAIKASFGNFGAESNTFNLPTGVAVDTALNLVVIVDANNNRVMNFPALP